MKNARGRELSRRQMLVGLAAGSAALGAGKIAQAACTVTPYQLNGPFYPTAISDYDWDMTRIPGRRDRAEGEVVEIAGRVLDTNCEPVRGAILDVWQANTHGRYTHQRDPNPAPLDPNFEGYARLYTGADGTYRLRTIIPGAYPVGPEWTRPSHVHFKVHPAMSPSITTQMYFAGDALNDKDMLYQMTPEALRPLITVAFDQTGADGVRMGTFDLHVEPGPELPF